MLIIVIVSCLYSATMAFPTGAPDLACKGMVPFHLPTTTSGNNPFILKINATSYKPGDTITGELYSTNNLAFRGFLIEVGTASTASEDEEGVGEFINIDSSIQKNVCGKAGVTHINKNDKQSVTFTWKAPQTTAVDVSVRATVVQKYLPSEYWVGAFSQRITAA